VDLLRYHTVLDGIQENLFTVTRDGAPVQYVGRIYKRATPQAGDYITLGAGQSITRTVSLAAAYDFSATGRYIVSHAGALKNSPVTFASNSVDLFIEGRPNVLPEEGAGEPAQALAGGIAAALSTTNCTSTRASAISTAISSATTYASNATSYLTNTTPGNTARYKTWFGNYTSTNWSTARTHFTNIRNAFQTQNVVVDCSCTDTGTYAYVYPTQPYKIYVCGAFWSAPATGTDSKAGTLVHEMSHFNVVASTDDWAYGQSACRSLASSNPTRALDNADSHEYFAENTPAQN
jgi:peptidyl-Lys metalloendopeptidase